MTPLPFQPPFYSNCVHVCGDGGARGGVQWGWGTTYVEKVGGSLKEKPSTSCRYVIRGTAIKRLLKNFQGYKQASKEAKKAVRVAKLKAYESFYTRLDSKDGEKIIYKLAKSREKRARDISQVKCIKGIDSVVLVKDEAIRDRWKSYFEKLLNEKHEGDFGGEEVYVPGENIEYEFYRRIQKFEVVKTLKRMKPGKALGPDGIPIEVWKSLGDLGATWLTKFFNKIIMTRKMPDE
ncbi:hypothetical protein RHMOL_Rhmol01G0213300 [Rhododendron molle]|uniref:Uncharacterized protein n=1 Tax=Rhododendron molle TaxID=49168 RepID=A0ACC0Q7B1_RHOML|nr:hypothetical protein RHMOL_Rhmol01G0213300 [Rhododendron molle]